MFLVGPPSPPLSGILYKKACGFSNVVLNSPINFIFGIAIDNTEEPYCFLAHIGLPKWAPAALLKNIPNKKLCIDLKWR